MGKQREKIEEKVDGKFDELMKKQEENFAQVHVNIDEVLQKMQAPQVQIPVELQEKMDKLDGIESNIQGMGSDLQSLMGVPAKIDDVIRQNASQQVQQTALLQMQQDDLQQMQRDLTSRHGLLVAAEQKIEQVLQKVQASGGSQQVQQDLQQMQRDLAAQSQLLVTADRKMDQVLVKVGPPGGPPQNQGMEILDDIQKTVNKLVTDQQMLTDLQQMLQEHNLQQGHNLEMQQALLTALKTRNVSDRNEPDRNQYEPRRSNIGIRGGLDFQQMQRRLEKQSYELVTETRNRIDQVLIKVPGDLQAKIAGALSEMQQNWDGAFRQRKEYMSAQNDDLLQKMQGILSTQTQAQKVGLLENQLQENKQQIELNNQNIQQVATIKQKLFLAMEKNILTLAKLEQTQDDVLLKLELAKTTAVTISDQNSWNLKKIEDQMQQMLLQAKRMSAIHKCEIFSYWPPKEEDGSRSRPIEYVICIEDEPILKLCVTVSEPRPRRQAAASVDLWNLTNYENSTNMSYKDVVGKHGVVMWTLVKKIILKTTTSINRLNGGQDLTTISIPTFDGQQHQEIKVIYTNNEFPTEDFSNRVRDWRNLNKQFRLRLGK